DFALAHDDELHVTAHDKRVTRGVLESLLAIEHDFPALARLQETLLATHRDPTNVEGPHGQLRARLTDRLRRNNADSLTDIHHRPTRKVAPVTLGTDAIFCLTGQRAADTRGLHR